MRRRFLAFALICVGIYLVFAILSVMVAHVLLVLEPQSGLAERIIAPVARGLEFVDAHWKSILILVAPFAAPVARDLVPRLRKAWGLEFDPLPLEPVGVHEKPLKDNQEQV
jgi:hypothetical protein